MLLRELSGASARRVSGTIKEPFIMKIVTAVLCLCVVGAPIVATAAQNASPVRVNHCRAEHNPGSPGGYSGYMPGYYPYAGRGYYWRDPYAYSYYQAPISPSGTLYIDFVNATNQEIKTVDFGLIARGNLIAEVRDVGTFAPGVEIKHKFGVDPNVFPLGTAAPACPPLFVEFANGTKWTNPNLPKTDRQLYQGHP